LGLQFSAQIIYRKKLHQNLTHKKLKKCWKRLRFYKVGCHYFVSKCLVHTCCSNCVESNEPVEASGSASQHPTDPKGEETPRANLFFGVFPNDGGRIRGGVNLPVVYVSWKRTRELGL
jgi:hypothetical protein